MEIGIGRVGLGGRGGGRILGSGSWDWGGRSRRVLNDSLRFGDSVVDRGVDSGACRSCWDLRYSWVASSAR